MQKILGIRFWIAAATGWLASGVGVAYALYGDLVALLKVQFGTTASMLLPGADVAIPMLIGALVLILLTKPFWRRLWRVPVVGRFLSSSVFPDLNGEWIMTLTSNWPRIDAMKQAASDANAPRYDTAHFDTVPLGEPMKFRARIDQSWFGVSMEAWSEDEGSVIKRSETASFDLLRGEQGEPQVAFFFEQRNRPENVKASDDDSFTGAARLEVSENGNRMEGYYMTRRSWLSGLNTAGHVVLEKVDAA